MAATKNTSFEGKHRRRHVRNETLTIVWNYTSTVFREWWAKASGRPTAEGGEEEGQGHRNRLWRILYGTYNTNQEDATDAAAAASTMQQIEASAAVQATCHDTELQESEPTKDVLVLDP